MSDQLTNDTKLGLKWIYLAWVGIALTSLVIGMISGIVQGPPEPVVAQWGISNFSVFAIALYSLGSAISVALLYVLLRRRGLNLTRIGLVGKFTPKAAAFSIAGLVVAFALYPVIESILEPFGIPMFWRSGATSALRLSTTLDLLLTLGFAVFVGPVAEEIVFRGYVLTALRERMTRPSSAYMWSAVVFASAHIFVGPGTILFIFFWSFIPAYLFLKCGNLYPAFCFHILNNFVTYVVFPLWIL
jgi:membrane protease YdiL (CAAX protease family)